ncbi:MAG: LacI family DNA-binding transcriptional regulator [bacterium]|nr:LacI family DNA-binding transcriptional regulator [bacterium]
MAEEAEKIESKEKKPGIKEVAKVAGVSPTTVSRVLNNRGYISEETRKKVYQAMDQIGYYPNEIARALLNHRTYFVGVIVPSIISPFHGEIVQNIEACLAKENYKMLLCNSNNKTETEKEYVNMLKRNQVDGMIVGTHNNNRDIMEEYASLSMPVVAIDRYLGEKIVMVSCDNYRVGEMATRHLLERGCRKILCIRGDSRLKMPGNDRSRAYKDMMKEMKLPAMILEVPFVKPTMEKRKLIWDMLEAHPEVDGIFAGDDSLAVIVLQIAREKGISVPQKLKVIGVDGARQTLSYVPELTTVQQPIEEISEHAVKKLIDLIEGRACESQVNLPVRLLQGKTT